MSRFTICEHDYAEIDQVCPTCWGDLGKPPAANDATAARLRPLFDGWRMAPDDDDLAYEAGAEDGRNEASIVAAERAAEQEAEIARLRAALEEIAKDDVLVNASGGAWGQQAYEWRRDIARVALDPEEVSDEH